MSSGEYCNKTAFEGGTSTIDNKLQLILLISVFPIFVTGWHQSDFSSTTPKPKFMIIGSRKQLAKISVDSVTVGYAMIKPVTSL